MTGGRRWRRVAEYEPDLILLDIMMPKLSGYEVCARLKDDEATRDIPIVMVTALNEMGDIEKAVAAGADDFLSKPVNKLELKTRVPISAAGPAPHQRAGPAAGVSRRDGSDARDVVDRHINAPHTVARRSVAWGWFCFCPFSVWRLPVSNNNMTDLDLPRVILRKRRALPFFQPASVGLCGCD